jgi:dimeric dUTPase (all-alpha-NTP-PPase superfamily)
LAPKALSSLKFCTGVKVFMRGNKTMEKQFEAMLTMQDAMNRRVHDDWVERHFEWYRALWIECAELIDHYGYKWWKKQTADMEQVRLEVVDIWHFGMSMLFDGRSIDDIAEDLCRQLNAETIPEVDILRATEVLACHTLAKREFSITLFWSLLQAADMSFDQLYRAYVGKNVLNFFRQDHGYQRGSYQKNWGGREDNEHLLELIAELDAGAADFGDQLYSSLQARYAQFSAPG